MSAREKWDARYAEPGWRMGREPKAVLVAAEPWLPTSGRALDLACGEGQTVAWLAARGLEVTGLDISPVGIEKARRWCEEHGVTADLRVQDLVGAAIEPCSWDLITCLHYLDRALWPAMAAGLKPGGVLVVEVLTEGSVKVGHARTSRFVAAPGELLAGFAGLEVLHSREGSTSASLVARRSGDSS